MTHTDEDLKAAEKRGYARGYQAKKRRLDCERMRGQQKREETAFRDRAFLAALPAFIAAQGWEMGGKAVSNLPDRIELSWRAAKEAMKQRRSQS